MAAKLRSIFVSGPGFEGGGHGDDAPTTRGGTEKKPGKEVGLEPVLARLADSKGEGGRGAGFSLGHRYPFLKSMQRQIKNDKKHLTRPPCRALLL